MFQLSKYKFSILLCFFYYLSNCNYKKYFRYILFYIYTSVGKGKKGKKLLSSNNSHIL